MADQPQQNAARVAAVTYLLTLVVLTAAFSRSYAPLLIWDKPAETARNFIAHEAAVRLYIVSAVMYGVGMMAILTAFYIVLRPISRGLALFAAFSRLVYVLMWFVTMLDLFRGLRLMSGAGYLQVFDAERLRALAGFELASGWDAYYIGLGFYGLGTLVFSYLWFRSRYIPRALAAWGILSSVFVGFCAFAYLVFPRFGTVLSVNWYEMPTVVFEFALSVWILLRGLRTPEIVRTAEATIAQ
jgi:hypothetical protein